MLGMPARAMMAVVARLSPELVGPQMAWTRSWLIISCVALTALVGSPCVSRVRISTRRPRTPPAALIASAANSTPRLKPTAGAELGPVMAASQPMRIGSACARAGVARAVAAKLLSARSRRVIVMALLVPCVVGGRSVVFIGGD